MKKLILGAAIAMSSLSFAQQFGVKAGMNISSISKDTWEDAKSKVGLNAGVFYNMPLASNFSIQPELLYSQYGTKQTETIAGTKYSGSLNLDYITIPVMFQYNIMPEFYLEAGPEFGFMVSAKQKYKVDGVTQDESNDFKSSLNTFNMGIGLGLGYNFTPQFGANARYVAGLNDFTNNDKWGDSASDKNGTFQVGVYYKFGK